MNVVRMLVQDERLTDRLLRRIENNRGLELGSLAPHEGRTIDATYRSEFLYDEARLWLQGGIEAAAQAPFVTAPVGFLLAAETLKAGPVRHSDGFGWAREVKWHQGGRTALSGSCEPHHFLTPSLCVSSVYAGPAAGYGLRPSAMGSWPSLY
jgi:hypothetical protein